MTKRFILTIFYFCVWSVCQCQDIHFSDYFSSPLNLNPSFTAQFIGNYRYTLNYRWQYGTVTRPFQTFSASTEFKIDADNRKMPPIGTGILFNYDFTGDSRYTSYQFGIPLVYHHRYRSGKSRISPSIMPLFAVNQININELKFPDQFVQDIYNQSIPTKDIIPGRSKFFISMIAAIDHTMILPNKGVWHLGFSLANINKPTVSFFKNKDSKLNRRPALMTKYTHPLTTNFEVEPFALAQSQGSYKEYQFGSKFIHYIDNSSMPMINYGLSFRAREKDALIIHAGCNYKGYLIGISYDINLSKLSTVSYGVGAFEVSLQYLYNRRAMPRKHEAMKCPTNL